MDHMGGGGGHESNVTLVLNGTRKRLDYEFGEFLRKLDGAAGCTVVLYFAGHAVAAAGESVLLPVNARLDDEIGTGTP